MKLFLSLIIFTGLQQVITLCNEKEAVTLCNENFQDMDNSKVLTEGKITMGSQIFKVIYYDNPSSRSLVEQMPFTVELVDYAGMEKIFYPTQSLSKEGAPKGADPSAGDIMYYAPWGDVAIFYRDFRYADGLIPLGKIEGDIAAFTVNGKIKATLEQVK